MKTGYAVVLMFTIMVAGTYWFSAALATCLVPIEYRIGELDERFGLTLDEARSAIDDAASIWEDESERNLFSYDEDAKFTINFIYDERQQTAVAAETLKETLDAKENINESLSETYSQLVARYQDEQLLFEEQKAAYQRRLNNYNEEVASYNEDGGAPPEVYEELESRRSALDNELSSVNKRADELNTLAEQINLIGERGNDLIDNYNDDVSRYNTNYGHSEEFTQGDYQGTFINIYTFRDLRELRLVLAHELGHALSIDHVENERSIMYYLMGDQDMDTIHLTLEDMAGFAEVCGDENSYERLRSAIISWLRSHDVL